MAPKNIMVGKWVPGDRKVVLRWMKNELEKLKVKEAKQYQAMKLYFPDVSTAEEEVREFVKIATKIKEARAVLLLQPVIEDLIIAMGTEPDVGMLIIEMFRQQDEPDALSARDNLFLLNYTIRSAPLFVDDETGTAIPCPIGAMLTYSMATPAGYAGFLKTRINVLFKALLDDYGVYLKNSVSKYVLVDNIPGGWFTTAALEQMPDFDETFNCKPGEPYKGFKSFDDFFTRTLRLKARPTASPENPLVVANACENAPYRVRYSVSKHDAFWIKSQPYSLQYVLDNDEYVDRFVGGTVYQGFLSPHTYHRFHAPVSGVIKRAKVVSGTYFSQPYYTDEKSNYIASQPYLAHVATRGIIIIDTQNVDVGYVAFVPIGMVEVSTVDLCGLEEGNTVTKGDNIGTFHFGGSSHLIIFEKGKRMAFDLQGLKPDPFGVEFLDVRSRLATIVKD